MIMLRIIMPRKAAVTLPAAQKSKNNNDNAKNNNAKKSSNYAARWPKE